MSEISNERLDEMLAQKFGSWMAAHGTPDQIASYNDFFAREIEPQLKSRRASPSGVEVKGGLAASGKCMCNMPPGFHADACPARTSPVPNGVSASEEMVERVAIALYDRFLERKAARNITFSPSTTPDWVGLVGSMKNDFIADAKAALAALEGGSQT